jgi:acetyl-CoA carboxylase carboxyl transferase subunit beta
MSSASPNESDPANNGQPARKKRGVPEGLWIRCDACKNTVFRKLIDQNHGLCPDCGHHFYISSQTRIEQLFDADSFEEWFPHMTSKDPLEFVDSKPYRDRIVSEQKKTGLRDACIVGKGYMRGRPVVFGMTDSAFIMGSMGSVVGEKLTRAVEKATELSLPLVIVSGSGGGARMHEGIISLIQMGKVSAALARYHEVGGLYISVLTNPTMGGVAASFASLGDVILAEPKALIGFAGPRVVHATVGKNLPEGFQTSEFLLEHGFVDRIVPRPLLKRELSRLIDFCG